MEILIILGIVFAIIYGIFYLVVILPIPCIGNIISSSRYQKELEAEKIKKQQKLEENKRERQKKLE
jgi:prepilin signal peptidase PulO-like enzyme (type II secretory pathway)